MFFEFQPKMRQKVVQTLSRARGSRGRTNTHKEKRNPHGLKPLTQKNLSGMLNEKNDYRKDPEMPGRARET